MLEWAPFILGGVSITIFVSVLSIFFATIFAVIGALGRLSRVAPIYAAATLYVSLVRGTPLIIQLIFWYLALPQFGIVLPGHRVRHLRPRVQLRRLHDRDLPGRASRRSRAARSRPRRRSA